MVVGNFAPEQRRRDRLGRGRGDRAERARETSTSGSNRWRAGFESARLENDKCEAIGPLTLQTCSRRGAYYNVRLMKSFRIGVPFLVCALMTLVSAIEARGQTAVDSQLWLQGLAIVPLSENW